MTTDNQHAAITVQRTLAALVASEDQKIPYSDDLLVHKLAQQGIDVARRTIAKYRDGLNIPPSHLRKKQYHHTVWIQS